MLGYLGNDRLKNIVSYNNDLAELRELVNLDNVLLNLHSQYLLTLQHDPAQPEIVAMHDHEEHFHYDIIHNFEKELTTRIAEFVAHPAAIPFLADSEEFQARVTTYLTSLNHGLGLFKAVRYQQANLNLLENMNPQLRDALKATGDFRDQLSQLAYASQMEADAFANRQTNLMVIFGVLFLLIIAILSWYITRAIRGGINDTVRAVTNVAETMDFSIQLKPRKDELNQISTALNSMLSSLRLGIAESNRVVGSIANGQFDQRIKADMKGDLLLLKDGVNASAESVAFMMNELTKVMEALDNGQLNTKMDESVPEGFKNKVEGALSTINLIIEDINHVMSKMEQGKFQHRVTAEARGSLLSLKERVNSSLQSLEDAINEITQVSLSQAKGDLTQTIKGTYHGELRVLKDAVNTSVSRLDAIVSVAVEAAHVVRMNSTEVSQGALDLSQRVQEQAAALEQTSSTMEQMSSAVKNNTENAEFATDIARGVQQSTSQGNQVMEQTIEAMTAIQESSHKIADIVTLIDGIAFQTNLLALNAAVEAARAGDHGRGFAVVAGEVRALAQKSAEAAKDIKHLIDESVTRIDQGTKLATQSGEVFNQVKGAIDEVTSKISEIASASGEQNEGIGQVHQAITSIDSVTQQNAALVEETSAAAESMRDQATSLMEKMSFFKTSGKDSDRVAKYKQDGKKTSAKALPQPSAKPNPSKTSVQPAKVLTEQSAKPAAKKSQEDWSEF